MLCVVGTARLATWVDVVVGAIVVEVVLSVDDVVVDVPFDTATWWAAWLHAVVTSATESSKARRIYANVTVSPATPRSP